MVIMMLTKEQIVKYLERIGLDAGLLDLPRDYTMLCRLQLAHVTTVPYENLDILRSVPLETEPEKLYIKIVENKRGGYCFELNGLFGYLLRSLGFTVVDYMARYLRGSDGIPKRRHRVVVAQTPQGRVLCDTGIGDSAARLPLLLDSPEIQEQYGEKYRITSDPFYGHVVSDFHKGTWRPQYGFTEEPQCDLDYIMPSFWCEKHPDSPFNKEYIVALKTETGRKTLSGNTYRIFDGDSVTETLLTDEEAVRTLKDVFGIE